jgi:O-antigen/teichoic acid export membrane protein
MNPGDTSRSAPGGARDRRRLRPIGLGALDGKELGPILISTLGEGGSRAINFVFYIIVARALTPSGFGEVRYSIALALIASGVSLLLATAANRELGAARGDPKVTGELLGSALVLGVLLWLASSGLCLAASAAGLTGSARPVGLVAAVTGVTIFQFYYQVARGLDAAGRAAITYLAGAIASLAGFLLLWALVEPTPTMTLVVFGAAGILPVAIAELARPVIPRAQLAVRREGLRLLWLTGGPLLAAGIGYLVWNSADQIWVETQLGTREIGLYSASRNLAAVLVVIPSGVVGVLLPRMAELVANGQEGQASRLLVRVATGTTAATAAIALILVLARRPLLSALYGSEYEPASAALAGLCVASVLYAGFIVFATSAVGWGRPRVYALGIGAAAVTELVVLAITDSDRSSTAAWAYAGSIGVGLAVIGAWVSFRPLGGRQPDAPSARSG